MNKVIASEIPSESFVTANSMIMATVMTGQLTTDHNIGVAGLHCPTKYDKSVISSSRIKLLVDGELFEPYDSEQKSVVKSRGYVDQTNIISVVWLAGGVEIRDYYFIPPDLDVLVHQIRLTNITDKPRHIKLFAVMYPHFGGQKEYKRGICTEAFYDGQVNGIIARDHQSNTLVYGFDQPVNEFQVGQVCSNTDVYYDLEDKKLSNCELQKNSVVNGALAIDLGYFQPNQQRCINLGMTVGTSVSAAKELFARFLHSKELLDKTRSYWRDWLGKGLFYDDTCDLGERYCALDRQSRVMLKTHQTHQGVMIVGSTAGDYMGAVAARNACYSLLALDRIGYHDEVLGGYEFLLDFKLGDDRFCSPDENDQLGTIIYCFRQHYDLTGDRQFLDDHYENLKLFGKTLANAIDPDCGLIYSERSIHEYVAVSRGYETYVNVMAFRGLKDLAFIAKLLGHQESSLRFDALAAGIQQAILKNLYCEEKKIFVKRVYQGRLDTTPMVSMISPALFGVLDPNDARVANTLAYVETHLWDPTVGGLYRYPLHLQPWDEIPFGGPWVTYTGWLARVYLKRGELDKACACLKWVIDNCPADTNTVPEHFSVAHQGRRGYHRTYYYPAIPETMATAEFLVAAMEYQKCKHELSPDKSTSAADRPDARIEEGLSYAE